MVGGQFLESNLGGVDAVQGRDIGSYYSPSNQKGQCGKAETKYENTMEKIVEKEEFRFCGPREWAV